MLAAGWKVQCASDAVMAALPCLSPWSCTRAHGILVLHKRLLLMLAELFRQVHLVKRIGQHVCLSIFFLSDGCARCLSDASKPADAGQLAEVEADWLF